VVAAAIGTTMTMMDVSIQISERTVETREEEEAVVAAAIGTTMTMMDVSLKISEKIV
jgi:hypothetical protein